MLPTSRTPLRLAAIAGLGLLSPAAAAEDAPTVIPATEAPASITVPAAPSAANPSQPAAEPAAPTPAAPASSAGAEGAQPNPLENRVRELEDTVRQLLGTIDTLQKLPPKPADSAQVEKIVDDKLKKQKPLAGWNNGFFVESQDGNFRLRLRALLQVDQRAFTGKAGRTGVDSFFLRRVRPIVEGTVYKHIDFKLVPDFAGGAASLQDAYLDFRYYPQASLRVGKFKEPVSLERLQSGSELHFIERSIAQNLAPNRDVGLQFYGDLLGNTLTYYAGLFNGVNDSASTEGDVDNDKDFAGRLFYQPFKNRPGHFAEGLGVGFGASIGEREEPLGATLRTAGRSGFFRYQGGADPAAGSGTHTRFSPGFYFFKGPVGLMGEYITSSQEVERLGVRDKIKNDGYFLQATYVLTGEKASFRGVVPRKEFDPRKGQWGAFELGARYSRINFDDDVFNRGFADAATAVGSANELTFGLNWYLNRAVKIQLNYVRTNFDRSIPFGATATDHEDVFLSRFQLAF
ncbi:MAG: porin [Armatimonadota bacterium]